jgi:hypothetical protein
MRKATVLTKRVDYGIFLCHFDKISGPGSPRTLHTTRGMFMYTLTILPRFLFIAIMIGLLLLISAEAQVTGKVLSVKTADTNEGNDITITAEIAPGSDIGQFFLLYRQYGQSEYRQIEMIYRATTATGIIPGSNATPPFVEYYVMLRMKNGTTETYPLQNPDANPQRATVLGRSEKDREVIVLSPEKNERLSKEDLFFSISLIYASSNVDKKATKLFIEGTDVSANAVMSNDILTYFPDNFPGTLSAGVHSYRVELRTPDGAVYHTITGSFTLAVEGVMAAEARAFKYGASLQAEARNEKISNVGTWYNRISLRLNGGWTNASFNSYIHITSEEKEYRQHQNRYSISGETSWLKIGLGDVYPIFPNLILNGQRVRGVSGNLLLKGFHLDVAYGEVIRGIEGTEIARFHKDSLPGGLPPTNSQRLSGSFADYYAQYSYGTFKRNVFAIRPSFGKSENFRLGLNYLHSIDDKGSVTFGVKPAENLVLGSDLLIGVDSQRFLFTAQAAMSIVNNDISNGNASDARIDSLFGTNKPFGGDPDLIKNLKNIASTFITVNENLSPLDPTRGGSLAYEAAISLNYFGNYLKASYISRGSEYRSFGQSYLRTDVQGFNIIDRLRLLENSLFLAGNLEMLSDNLNKTKFATTKFTNFNFSVSYYPRFNFPNVTIGIGGYGNNNAINVTGRDSSSAVDNMTMRFFTQLGYDFTYYARHSASLSVSALSTDDRTLAKLNTKNTVVAAGVTTSYKIPLQTTVNLTLNYNTLPSLYSTTPSATSKYNYTTLSLNGVYRLLDEKLRVGATFSPTFGDMKRTLMELMSQYMITPQQSLAFQLYLINNPDNPASTNDIIASLVYRLDL